MNLVSKYRPKVLSDVLGQTQVVNRLRNFLREPHSVSFLFAGATGTGKTATAECLARELGIAVDEGDFGGLYQIPSGRMVGENVEDAVRKLRSVPFFGSGWKMLICNEQDRCSLSAETIWLDVLDAHNLPPRCIFVFTTNAIESISQRFKDRCEVFNFEGRSDVLRPHIQKLAAKIWAEECPGIPPKFGSSLGMPSLGGPDSMHASFRMACQQLAALIREAKSKQVQPC